MNVGEVAALWRYPVKSMGGEELQATTIAERGLLGDRAYALVDSLTGKVASAKLPRTWGRLLACSAAYTLDPAPGVSLPPLRLILADGREVVEGRDDLDGELAVLLGRRAGLAAVVPPNPEIERWWPDIDGMLARGVVTAGPIGLGAPPGTFFDHAPVHLVTTATLDRLRALAPGADVDARRFRPNLVVASPGDAAGFVEQGWVGRVLRIGAEIRLRVTDPTPRCVVPTLPQGRLPRDLRVLQTVVAHARAPIPALGGQELPSAGAYAVVERGGAVRVGDEVRLAAD